MIDRDTGLHSTRCGRLGHIHMYDNGKGGSHPTLSLISEPLITEGACPVARKAMLLNPLSCECSFASF